jgi:hypothetical protein
MTKLKEGLRKDDLIHMMSNRVSVDEYESKIDDSAIVVGFFANSKDVANDVNRFLQKSYVDLLDTEVSAAPDQTGYYMVFVEMLMNNKTSENIASLCRELSSLTSIENWEFSVRGHDDTHLVALDNIQTELAEKVKDLVESWLPEDTTTQVNVYESYIELHGLNGALKFEIADYGQLNTVVARNNLNETPINFKKYISDGYKNIKNILGESWQIDCAGELMLAYNTENNKLLLIKSRGI